MSCTYTVTVIHDRDPNPSPDQELQDALISVGSPPAPEHHLASDPVFYLRVAEQDANKVVDLADRFLAGSPACRAVVEQGVSLPQRSADEAAIVVQRRPGVTDPVSQSVIHAMAESGFDRAECQVRTALRYRLGGMQPTQQLLDQLGRHGQRPAHIHFFISAPDHRHLTTQINLDGDQYLHDDFAYATCP